MPNLMRRTGRRSAGVIEDVGLWIVLIATVVAGGLELWKMIGARAVTLADILLLFIYLEVITMVDVYWRSGKLPVRMPLYIAMVALARFIIIEASHFDAWQVVGLSAAILVLAIAVLIVRFGHLKLPYPETEDIQAPGSGHDRKDARDRPREAD